MTVAATASYVAYVADGATTTYAFPFYLFDATHLQVYVGGALSTAYTVSGVGVPAGGSITFYVAPPANQLVQLFNALPLAQPTSYPAGAAFPAAAHEAALDRLCLQLQRVEEEIERKPGFVRTIAAALRNLLWPAPQPLTLLGWDALGTGLTLYNAAVVQVTPAAVSGLAWAKATQTLTATNNAAVLVAPALFPAGSIGLGVTARGSVSFGTTHGLTGLSLGYADNITAWGRQLSRLSTLISNGGQWELPPFFLNAAARDIWLSAEGGLFDAAGACTVTGHYLLATPD